MPVGRVALPPVGQAVGVSVTRRVITIVSRTVCITGVVNGQVVELFSDAVGINDENEEPVPVGKKPVEFSDSIGFALDAIVLLAVGKKPVEFAVISAVSVDAAILVEKTPVLLSSLYEKVAFVEGVGKPDDTAVPPVEYMAVEFADSVATPVENAVPDE